VTFERNGRVRRSTVGGVSTTRFERTLSGEGWVFGIKLRPAALSALSSTYAGQITDRIVPVRDILGSVGASLAEGILGADRLECRIRVAEELLEPLVRPLEGEAARARDLVEKMAIDRSLLRAQDAADAMGVSLRTLERIFARHVGVSPKWIIRRYRLHEAAEQLREGKESLAGIAAALGYADQAHFAREFKQVIGATPKEFAERYRPTESRRKRA
jgi:AraC-like DNA-binding protein